MSDNKIVPLRPRKNVAPDPWALDDNFEYSPEKFYTGSRDENRDSITLTVNIPTSLYGRMETLIQSKSIPKYKTKQDIVRDALYHRMYFIKDFRNDPRLEDLLGTLLAQEEAEQASRELKQRDATVDSIKQNLGLAIEAGDQRELEAALDRGERTLSLLPDCKAKRQLADILTTYSRMADE